MKVASLVYATWQGLGILAKAFYDHGVVTDPLVVRHGRHVTHDHWYPASKQLTDLRNPRQVQEVKDWLEGMDVFLAFETPFIMELIPFCKSVGVKTVIMPMHECWHKDTPLPDLFLCPSHLDQKVFGEMLAVKDFAELDRRCPYIPVPVETPWRQRTECRTFVHNAGHGGLKGRNGTNETIEALKYIRSPAHIIMRSQEARVSGENWLRGHGAATVEFSAGTADYATLWDEGDCFLFPEKFNGLSLPLQEARAAGMLVMCGDRFPMNRWLPRIVETTTPENKEYRTHASPLIPVSGYHRERVGGPYMEYDCAEFRPQDIAAKVDEWYGRDVSAYSLQGREWAEANSWTKLGPQYIQVLEELCQK